MHGLLSSHELGQGWLALAGSHVSPASKKPLPQLTEQSLSVAWVQMSGQQPSPDVHTSTLCMMHVTLQLVASPMVVASKQALAPAQVVAFGQVSLGSQVSPTSMLPLPQAVAQSSSLLASAPLGQQPSPGVAIVIG